MRIVVEHLTKAYRAQCVLNDISCSFQSGQIHGIVGRNGSGKTVLLRCLCGYAKLTSGKIWIGEKLLGTDIFFPPFLGLLLDTPMFLPQFSGYDNLMLLMNIHKREYDEKKALIQEALQHVALSEHQNIKVANYSLGMRQRLGIAQAIMEKPKLLILDEPFNGLDRDGVKKISALFKKMRSSGVTVLLTSHYPSDLENLCDTITCLDGGQILQQTEQ